MNVQAAPTKANVEEGAVTVAVLLGDAEDAIAKAIQAVARLQMKGLDVAAQAGVSVGLVGEAVDYIGRSNADLCHSTLMLQGAHNRFHEALERLSPTEERSGPGDKTPPPKP